jgi:hypothetical protein
MTEPRIDVNVSIIHKSRTKHLCVALKQTKGGRSIDVRDYTLTGSIYFPSVHGVQLPVEHLPALASALNFAVTQAHEMGWLSDEAVPQRLRRRA